MHRYKVIVFLSEGEWYVLVPGTDLKPVLLPNDLPGVPPIENEALIARAAWNILKEWTGNKIKYVPRILDQALQKLDLLQNWFETVYAPLFWGRPVAEVGVITLPLEPLTRASRRKVRRKTDYQKRVTLSFTPSELAQLDYHAEQRNLTRTGMVARLIAGLG